MAAMLDVIDRATVAVTFVHDNDVKKWSIYVKGATGTKEAMQAFNAVALTCRDENVQVGLGHMVQVHKNGVIEIIPQVRG